MRTIYVVACFAAMCLPGCDPEPDEKPPRVAVVVPKDTLDTTRWPAPCLDAACQKIDRKQFALMTWQVTPLDVVAEQLPSGAHSFRYAGTFRLEFRPIDGPIGMHNGGACLYFQPATSPTMCSADAICANLLIAGKEEGVFGKCDAAAGQKGTCWWRPATPPDRAPCIRVPPPKTLDKNHLYTTPYFDAPRDRARSWRVLSCQWLAGPEGCQSENDAVKKYRWGPYWFVPPGLQPPPPP